MVTGYYPREYISRPSYSCCPKGTTVWNSLIYRIRSILLCRILLSFLSLKPSTHSRTRSMLTTHRYYPSEPARSTTSQYFSTSCIRSVHYLSSSQLNRGKPQAHTPSPIHYYLSRRVFYTPTSLRVLWGILHYFRWSLRLNFFHSDWISRTSCNHWLNFSHSLFPTTTTLSFHIKSPFRLWSSSMILTLRRCRMTIPICFHLLMRVLLL